MKALFLVKFGLKVAVSAPSLVLLVTGGNMLALTFVHRAMSLIAGDAVPGGEGAETFSTEALLAGLRQVGQRDDLLLMIPLSLSLLFASFLMLNLLRATILTATRQVVAGVPRISVSDALAHGFRFYFPQFVALGLLNVAASLVPAFLFAMGFVLLNAGGGGGLGEMGVMVAAAFSIAVVVKVGLDLVRGGALACRASAPAGGSVWAAVGQGAVLVFRNIALLLRMGFVLLLVTLAGFAFISMVVGIFGGGTDMGVALQEILLGLHMALVSIAGWGALFLLARLSAADSGVTIHRRSTTGGAETEGGGGWDRAPGQLVPGAAGGVHAEDPTQRSESARMPNLHSISSFLQESTPESGGEGTADGERTEDLDG